MFEAIKNPKAQTIIRCIILALSVVTFVFASVSVGHCSFVRLEGYSYYYDSYYDSYRYVLVSLKAGLYSYYDKESSSCEQYDDIDFDPGHKTARAFGGLLVTFTPIIMVTTLVAVLFLGQGCTGNAIWMTIRIMVLFAICCQAFTFFILKDFIDDEDIEDISLGAAGGIAAANAILLIALSVLTWLVPSRKEPLINLCKTNEEPVTPQPMEQPYPGKYNIPPPAPIVQPGPIYVEQPTPPTTKMAPEEDID